MSSGVKWNEDYADPNSDINRYGEPLQKALHLEILLKASREKGARNFSSLCKH